MAYNTYDQPPAPTGPAVKPGTAAMPGGGAALPPYLQTRVPMVNASQMPPAPTPPTAVRGGTMVNEAAPTQPVVTPKSTAVPGEVATKHTAPIAGPGMPAGPPPPTFNQGITFGAQGTQAPGAMGGQPMAPQPPSAPQGGVQGLLAQAMAKQQQGPPRVPPAPPAGPPAPAPPGAQQPQTPSGPAGPQTPPQAGGTDLGGVYQFFKSDLENQKNQALADTRADASARGVFYGTPLTGSEADINTQYLRGLGQLQSGMYGNEQQNQLARLGLASNLLWQSGLNAPSGGGIDPSMYSMLGQLFGQNAGLAGQRPGPSGPTPQGKQINNTGGGYA